MEIYKYIDLNPYRLYAKKMLKRFTFKDLLRNFQSLIKLL